MPTRTSPCRTVGIVSSVRPAFPSHEPPHGVGFAPGHRMETEAYRRQPGCYLGVLAAALLFCVSCHPKPTILTSSSAAIGGTIAGVLTGPSDSGLGDRTVAIINIETGQRYETKTGPNG